MRTNRHHLYWPRAWYKTKLEKTFRNLPCNVVRLDIETHKAFHLYCQPPVKPPISFMKDMVERHKHRHCGCYDRR